MATTDPYVIYPDWLNLVQKIRSFRKIDFTRRFVVGRLDEHLARSLKMEISERFKQIQFSTQSGRSDYFVPQFDKQIETIVKNNYVFFEPTNESALLRTALKEICAFSSRQLYYPVRIVNARIWTLDYSADAEAGGNAWHRDGMPTGVYKVMCYLTAPCLANGTTEIERDDGEICRISGEAGTLLLFDPNELQHRGIAPRESGEKRIVLEVTVIPALYNQSEPIFAGTNAQYPRTPWNGHRISAFLAALMRVGREHRDSR